MPTRPLPNDPSLEHLRKDAKRLRRAVLAGALEALDQVEEFHPRTTAALPRFALADAQLVIARSYGFASWTALKQHLAEIEPFFWNPSPDANPASPVDMFVRLACLTYLAWHPSNVARAQRMLAEHPDLTATSVHAAAAAGDVDAVRNAIDREPALVHAKGGPLQWPLLLYACYSRLDGTSPNRSTVDVAGLLLSRGADPDAGFLFAGSYAFTALTGAFGRGEDWFNQPPHPECDRLATLLLEAGADPNDSQALYNRHFFPDDGHLDLLFRYGLGRDKGGPWPKRLGGENSSPERMLVQQLSWAISHGYSNRVKLLVARGVDVNAPSPRDGRTPYAQAIRAGHAGIADYLREHGAHATALDPLEAFAVDCIAGRREAVRARLSADPSLLDRLGHHGRIDMLHRAADGHHEDGLRLIVSLGVDINGMVPGTGLDRAVLHNAAGWGGLALVKLLLELGADRDLRDLAYRAKPIGWAVYHGQRDVVDYLLQFATVFDAVRAGGLDRVAVLIDQDPALANARDEDGDPLVFSLNPGTPRVRELIRLLAARGADFSARDREGTTVLERALSRGWIDFEELVRGEIPNP